MGHPRVKTKPSAPNPWGIVWAAGASKSDRASTAAGGGVPTSSLLARSHPSYTPQHPQQRGIARFGILGGVRLNGEEIVTHKPLGVVYGTFPSNSQPSKMTLPKAFGCLGTRVGQEEMLPPCGRFL